ncbi:hypothetical protein B0T17DRAFT_617601 [Bombardia bombarda]|uniref:Uncharacterized protein n=1 Tax=Bombardia bombarda TaxID=252184 RepID=A0AA39X1E4_9PEZI|nr:hypothetical protein B0T17DRAFT_617601 [Bombardia bombarda]
MRMVAAQVASRFTAGLPLCRNEDYLRNRLDIGDGLMMSAGAALAGAALAAPSVLRPLVGRVVSRRLCVSNFGSMHQTWIQAANLSLNIIGSDSEY